MGKSPEELKRIRSEAGKKAAATRRANAQAAVSRKQETKQKTKSSKWDWLLPLLLVLAIVGIYIWKPWVSKAAPATPAPVSTEAPALVSTEAPAPTETPAPTTAPVVQPATPAEVAAICPTTGEAQALFGVNVQRIDTEACGWVWRGKPEHHSATCPTGYVCSFDVVNDITVVHLGIDQQADLYAGTFRLISAYPAEDKVHDVCELYKAEKEFGLREVPSYEVRFQPVPGVGPQTCP